MVELNDQIRNAVHREDCRKSGHQINISNLLAMRHDSNSGGVELRSSDELKLPHLFCDRCDWTAMVLPVDGYGYEDAERLLYRFLDPKTDMAKRIARIRGQREERSKNGQAQPEADPEPEPTIPEQLAAELAAERGDAESTSDSKRGSRGTSGSVGQAS